MLERMAVVSEVPYSRAASVETAEIFSILLAVVMTYKHGYILRLLNI